MTNELFADAGLPLPRSPVNAAELMVEIGMAVFRVSVQRYGRVTADFQQEIITTMVGYLESYVRAAKAAQTDQASVPRPARWCSWLSRIVPGLIRALASVAQRHPVEAAMPARLSQGLDGAGDQSAGPV